jgi:hypothetical protein
VRNLFALLHVDALTPQVHPKFFERLYKRRCDLFVGPAQHPGMVRATHKGKHAAHAQDTKGQHREKKEKVTRHLPISRAGTTQG